MTTQSRIMRPTMLGFADYRTELTAVLDDHRDAQLMSRLVRNVAASKPVGSRPCEYGHLFCGGLCRA